MVIDERQLDELIDFVETNKRFGFTRPSVQIGEYRGYIVRVELRDPDEEEKEGR